MFNDVTDFNIREYLSTKDDKKLGEEELRELLSEFSCSKNMDAERVDVKEVKVGKSTCSRCCLKRTGFSD